MLSLYDTIKVPDVDYVLIHRDDEDPAQFYMVTDRPTIAVDDDNNPLLTFILYARDLDNLGPEDSEIQRAYLSLTTQAAVSDQDEQKIRQYLKRLVRFNPKLSYPPAFIDGSVEFVTFNEDLVRFSTGSKQPSLIGANLASFSQQFSQEGSEVFRQSVEQGVIPAIVNYSLTYLARIPAVSIHIHGNRRDFYEELKRHTIVTHTKKKNGKVVYKKTWPEIGSLKEFRDIFHSLTIDIDSGDFRDEDPNSDLTQKLETMAFGILETNILPSFFETAFTPATEEQSSNKWLKEVEKEMEGEIDVHINKRDVIQKRINPNAQLSEILTPEQIKRATIYVDASQQFFQELDVTVNANVNFEDDPVYALKVFLDYDQQDDVRNVRVKKAKEYLFKNAGDVHRFRQIMAKNSDGSPKDIYQYWSELVYKNTGETIRIPNTGTIEARERQLVISYQRLGFKKVTIALGAMPEVVDAVRVNIRYPGSNASSAKQSFELTRDNPLAVFFTYTGHSGPPRDHVYDLVYVLKDGQQMETREQRDNAETLTIPNPFEQSKSTRFLAQADFSVIDKVIVDAIYRDQRNDYEATHHAELMSNGETSGWTFSLRDPNLTRFTYNIIIVYQDGSSEEKTDVEGELGDTIPVGTGGVEALEVQVDAGLVDWDKYRRIFVYLEYEDPGNNLKQDEILRFSADSDDFVMWKVLLRDSDKTSFRHKLRYFGAESGDNFEGTWQETDDPVLVLEEPVR
ncbi:MAG: hypothetical protein AAF921_03425 [Cyanobacteria bacterium P01_D01_bin.44]